MERRSYLQDTKSERKAWRKAANKSRKLDLMSDYSFIRSIDDDISSSIASLTENIVRYNRDASDYDYVLRTIISDVFRLMKNPDELKDEE